MNRHFTEESIWMANRHMKIYSSFVIEEMKMKSKIRYHYSSMPIHFIVLRFIALCRHYPFSKLKVRGNPVSSKLIGTIFPIAFVHFVSLCLILAIFKIFQTCLLWLYLLWWSVISDLWGYYCNFFVCGGVTMNCAHVRWWTQLINVLCVLTAPLPAVPLSPFPQASLFPDAQQY